MAARLLRKQLEIERKFLVKEIPAPVKRAPFARIVQGYFPLADKGLEVRLRRKDAQHFITIKRGRGLARLEQEIKIPAASFRAMWPLTSTARISKRRYTIPFAGHVIELDVYNRPYRGLVTADVEFRSLRESRAFKRPHWLGREITGNRRYANEALARRQGTLR